MSDPELSAFLAGYPPAVRDLALEARRLILQVHPTAVPVVRKGWKIVTFGVGERMDEVVCGITPTKDRVTLMFAHGAVLPDPTHLLEGIGASGRHVKVRASSDLRKAALRALIRAAFDRMTAAAPSSRPATRKGPGRPKALPRGWTPPVSDAAITEKTGRGWKTWLAELDEAGAASLAHGEIVRLASKRGAGAWHRQMIAVGYEQARGLRVKHQTPDGFQASVSKTVSVPVERLFRAFDHAPTRAQWLPDWDVQVSTRTAPKSLRGRRPDGVRVEVLFLDKGAGKSAVQVSHLKLPDAAAVMAMKAWWAPRLAALKALLER